MAVYITGDIHGSVARLTLFCEEHYMTDEKIIVLLGDVGVNYFLNHRDEQVKSKLNALGPTLLCIHGNHEARPWHVPHMGTKEWHGGSVFIEEKYPNLLYAKDGEIYQLEGKYCMAIGGAYSIDKHLRIIRGFRWFADEQPSDEIKAFVESQLKSHKIDIVFSHTCPAKYTPIECYLPGIDQSHVDTSTEDWLDKIEETIDYKSWFCGHWHIDKTIDRMHFLFNEFELLLPKEEKR